MQQTMSQILSRLNDLEKNRASSSHDTESEIVELSLNPNASTRNMASNIIQPVTMSNVNKCDSQANCDKILLTPPLVETVQVNNLNKSLSTPGPHASDITVNSSPVNPSQSNSTNEISSSVQSLVDVIKTLNPSRSQNYYVSNFDPSIHDIDVWCEEVDRAKSLNGWSNYECLSRVASCLKGDARIWLNEWVSNDRSWSNFVLEFKPLCPRRLDYANILFEVMNTSSDKYTTYPEYARRSLLRLRIVKGLSEELMIQIIIRGISDPQVRAAAANASLTAENLVSFLSIHVKPTRGNRDFRAPLAKKRPIPSHSSQLGPKCYSCGQSGHKSYTCPKKARPDTNPDLKAIEGNCAFCKKPGHTESTCFAKNRSQPRNKRNVNLCEDRSMKSSIRNNDVVTAVVHGIPIDILIDSGALDVSLVSSDVLKYFSCQQKPTHCALKGISDKEVVANSYVTLTVEFSEISIEADFIVVPAACMSTPIIIGTDILNREGVTYVRTKDKQYLTRSAYTPARVNAIEHCQVNTQLQGPERDSLMSVIHDFSKYLISGTASSTVKTGKMHIRLNDLTPVAYRPYKLSHPEKLKVRQKVSDLLDKKIIRESQSEYASPIILVKKKDGSDRMCVDYRALNRLTVKDRYPLPLIDDHIDRLGNFKFFTSLDMATGFHQIPLDEESICKTGFVTPEGHYEYLKMPYGLTNSPIVYQRIINDTLRAFIDAGKVLVYVDDVLIMSSTVDEGIALLRDVLLTLTEAGFSINLRKCSFLATEVEYLGRVVSENQVRPSPRKVEALVNAPVPGNVRQVRQFLGLAGYFRRYIQDYATKTACISRLTKKNVDFCWGPEQEQVRLDIIDRLTNEPILAIFDPALPTEVHTDASSVGYGAVLLQTHADGKKHVIAYFSKVTQGAESRYHSYELETLAVVKALQHFRHYLVGLQFKVVTDCNALKSTEKKKDLLPRVARWWIYLQDFTFEIEYRKGTLMSHADYLSRNPPFHVHHISKPRNWAQIAQAADEETRGLLQKLQEGRLDSSRYLERNDLLYYRYTPVGEEPRLLCFIPKGHRLSLLRVFHDEHEHVSAEKTLDLILKHFWFPGLRQFVAKYIAHCLVCISKKRVPRAPLQNITSWEKPDMPFNTLHLDALGPLPESNGFKFILLMVDAFTKFTLLYPIYRQDAEELKRAMSNSISLFGSPKLLITDRGRMFEAVSFVKWVHDFGCDIHYVTPEMHHSNGQVERYVRTVLNMIRIEVNHKNSSWSESLWKLQLVLNVTKQKTTQVSALNLLIGTDATTPVIKALVRDVALGGSHPNREAWREICRTRASALLKKNQTKQDAYANQQRRPPRVFKVNDLVFVIKYFQSVGKLDPGMRGPYKVIKTLPGGRYELKLLSGSYGKTSQAAAQYMVPWRGEWCPESCASFFESLFETDGVHLPSTECDYQFSRSGNRPTHGRLYSPRYPSIYPNNVRCSYHFHARPKERVKVVFEEISLQKGDVSCLRRADIIKVFDGRDTNAPAIAMLCNELTGIEVLSTGPSLLLQFTANSATPGQGFAATFHFQPPPDSTAADSDRLLKLSFGKAFESLGPEVSATTSSCHQEFSSDGTKHGTLTSPHFPSPYPPNTHCHYEFFGRGKERVRLIFQDFYLYKSADGSSDCSNVDSLQAFVNVDGRLEKVETFCGVDLPNPIMSNGPKLMLEFRGTHSSRYSRGFKISYSFVENFGISTGRQLKEFPCAFVYNSTESHNGTFASPNSPGSYPRDTECTYFFHGGETEKVHLHFTKFDIEGVLPCEASSASDYVEFSNHMTEDTRFGRYCGLMKEFHVESERNFFKVTFRSNDRLDGAGFKAIYQFLEITDEYQAPIQDEASTSVCILGHFLMLLTISLTQLHHQLYH